MTTERPALLHYRGHTLHLTWEEYGTLLAATAEGDTPRALELAESHLDRERSEGCLCPDPYCPTHARCIMGHELIIEPDEPAFCPTCLLDVMPRGACWRAPQQGSGQT